MTVFGQKDCTPREMKKRKGSKHEKKASRNGETAEKENNW